MANVGEIKARLILDSSHFDRNLNTARNGLNETTRSAIATKKSISDIQKVSMTMGLAVATAIGASVKAAANFEQGMANVKAVSGATSEEMKKLTDLAIEMGEKTSFSATEASQGIEELIKAGVSVTDILNGGLQGALDLAVAGNIALADSAEIASTALNAFKDDNLSVIDAANLLAGAANASATDVGELKFGLSMVSAVASGVGSSFEDVTTALALFAQNGLKGSDAGTSLKTMLLNLQPATEAQFGEFQRLGLMTYDVQKGMKVLRENGIKPLGSDFVTVDKQLRGFAAKMEGVNHGTKKAEKAFRELTAQTGVMQSAFYDSNGSIKSMDQIAGTLKKSLEGMTDAQRQVSLEVMFGTDAIRAGNILYKEGAEGINKMNEAMSKVTAAEVAAVKLDTLMGSVNEFTSVLETAGIKIGSEFLPAITNIVDAGTEAIGMFNEIDPATVSLGLKMAGTSAAIALVGTSVVKLVGSLRTLLVSMGPAGWIIGGLSILGGYLVAVKDGYDKLNDVNLENVTTMIDQKNALSNNIQEYDKLRLQSSLTNDELSRFVDINSEITKTADPNVIARLRDEQEKLREKSGLSNDELDKMVGLNKGILEIVPQTSTVLTEQGNVLLENTDKAKKYNQEQMELIRLELEAQRAKAESNLSSNLEKEASLMKEINKLKAEKETYDQREMDQTTKVAKLIAEYAQAKGNNDTAEMDRLSETIALEERRIESIKKQRAENAQKLLDKSQEIKKIQEEIGKLDEVKRKMIEIELSQVGINAKRGEEVSALTSEINKLEEKKKKLEQSAPIAQRNTQEYKNATDAIQKQIDNLDKTKSKIEEIIGEVQSLNDELGKSITKSITVRSTGNGRNEIRSIPTYHTGGIAGLNAINQLPKLHSGGLPFQLSNQPLHNEIDVRLLRNEMILTESQQANLIRMLDAGLANEQSNKSQKVEKNFNMEVTINSEISHAPFEEKRKLEQIGRKLMYEFD
jgi:hypothetical protein